MSDPEPPKSINVRKVGDNLAVRRPAMYLLTLNERLAKNGDAVVDRFFRILTDPGTDEKTFLRYLKELHNLMNVKEIGALMLALQKKGRPTDEVDPEDVARRKVYADVLTRYPEKDATDAEFTPAQEEAPPPRKRRSG